MADDPLLFRVFLRELPGFLDTWRPAGEGARWDRHYLLSPGHSLRLTEGRRVQLHRMRAFGGFRVEQTVLDAAFPLDWMALAIIDRALPPASRGAEVDGRNAQTFVDSLAHAQVPQASLLTRARRYWHGTTVAEAAWLSVPDWKASATALTFESGSAPALRALLAATGLTDVPHRDLEDWLRASWRAANPPPAPAEPKRPVRAAPRVTAA